MRIERFFHIRPNDYHDFGDLKLAPRGGATVRVIGDTDGDTVTFQVAYCSANDQFCRKTGRDVASKHPMTTTYRDSLPQVLQDVSRNVVKSVMKVPRARRSWQTLWMQDYSFATRYFEKRKEEAKV